MGLKAKLVRAIPDSLLPVARFHYRRLKCTLDPELSWICAGLDRGSVAIDAGANDGIYSYALLRTGASVEAFEPQPSCAAVLRKHAARNPRLKVHAVALGSQAGEADLFVPRVDGALVRGHASLSKTGGEGDRFRVPVRTIDSFGFPKVDVLKIDVEGHEYDVIVGGAMTIERSRPRLLVEIEQRHTSRPISEVFEAILRLGYRGFFLMQGAKKELKLFDPDIHQASTAVNCPSRYINNFLFEPV